MLWTYFEEGLLSNQFITSNIIMATEDLKEVITWNDFEKIDMRIGTILEAVPFPKAKKPAYQLKVDFGPLGIKQSSAQITAHYTPEALIGKQVMAVVNVPRQQIANFFSECLVMGIYDASNEVVLLQPEQPVPNGSRVG